MKKEHLDKVIDSINIEDNNESAYLGIFYQHENTFIKANQKGILNLVVSLLKGLKDFDFHLSKEDHYSIIKLEKGNWYDTDGIILDAIEPTNETKNEIYNPEKKEPESSKWYEFIITFTIYLVLIFLLTSFLVGIFTSLKWLYKLTF